MALVRCKECKSQISDTADVCPHCGAKPKKPTSRFTILVGGLFAIGVLAAVVGGNDKPTPVAKPKSAEQIKLEQEEEAAFQSDVRTLRALRDAMKNPASFDLVQAGRMEDKTLCVVYRGTNSFNAVTMEQKAISAKGKLLDYNKVCAGKTPIAVVTHAKHAL